MAKRKLDRRGVLEQMMALATGAANDAVKLAYLDREELAEIDGLDLHCLTEFKRSGTGAVEVMLTDRAAVLVLVLEQMKEEVGQGAAAFLAALDQSLPPAGREQEAVSQR